MTLSMYILKSAGLIGESLSELHFCFEVEFVVVACLEVKILVKESCRKSTSSSYNMCFSFSEFHKRISLLTVL